MTRAGNEYELKRVREFLPLDQLLALAEKNLDETLSWAASLPLYKTPKLKRGNHYALESLRQLPFLSRQDLIEIGTRSVSGKSRVRRVQLWGSRQIQQGAQFWYPRGLKDITRFNELAGRLASVSEIKPRDVILVLSQAGHGATNALPYALADALKIASIPAQIIPANMTIDVHVKKWADFLIANPPSVIIAEPKDALGLAGILRGITQQPLMPELRFILLYGMRSAGESGQVEQIYRVPVRRSVGFDGLDVFGLECTHRQGVHLWLDTGLYELIADEELLKESSDLKDVPKSSWLWETERGVTGELVVTSFSELLPLIRFRTGLKVEFAGVGDCPCGRSHPRIKLL